MSGQYSTPKYPWDELLAAAADFQGVVPGAVLVGGTATAIHVQHRFSNDADHTMGDLSSHFREMLDHLEMNERWETARMTPPLVILGSFDGVETTLRQLRRTKPLETTTVSVQGHEIVIPTVAEMIRVKTWMALTRNAFRDYLDIAALTAHAGEDETIRAYSTFDDCYREVHHKQVRKDVSPLLQAARQFINPMPGDLKDIREVAAYKGIVDQWNSWDKIAEQCRQVGVWATTACVDRFDLTLQKMVARTPDYPKDTHRPFLLDDGETVVVKEWSEERQAFYKIDNPLGPAIVAPNGIGYSIDGRRMSEEDWKRDPKVLGMAGRYSRGARWNE
jgi:hypothetical protein